MRWPAAYGLLLLCVAGCAPHGQGTAPSKEPRVSPSASSGLPPITIHSHGKSNEPVRIVEQQGNKKIYELQAQSTESSMESQSQFRGTFSKTHVTFYGSDGSNLVGDAPLTTIDKATQRVVMQGGVVGKTNDGMILRCDELQYNRSTGQLHGIGNVHIISAQGYSLTGGSFTSDLKLTHVHMQ
ncbi:MAG: hypothetical protein M3N19_01610 [Candidatus Eremiobacteraeota bacterium]|nr:hypothetical protein [Candidatus Eremiobacteraeota bacterium]